MQHVYRLSPIPHTLHDPRWRRSDVRGDVWVWAKSPETARDAVAMARLTAGPAIRGAVLLPSPWLDDAFAICTLEPSKPDVPEGEVVNSIGWPV
jgi:hypothetical protein